MPNPCFLFSSYLPRIPALKFAQLFSQLLRKFKRHNAQSGVAAARVLPRWPFVLALHLRHAYSINISVQVCRGLARNWARTFVGVTELFEGINAFSCQLLQLKLFPSFSALGPSGRIQSRKQLVSTTWPQPMGFWSIFLLHWGPCLGGLPL